MITALIFITPVGSIDTVSILPKRKPIKRALNALEYGSNVVVDNINQRHEDFARYLGLASPTVEVRVVKVVTYFGSKRNIPKHIIESFDNEYKPYEGEGQVMMKDGKLLFKWTQ